jgi:Peptidase M15
MSKINCHLTLKKIYLLLPFILLLAGCPSADNKPEPIAPEARAGEKPQETKALPRKPRQDGSVLEVMIPDVPELSGNFWAGDLICLPPAFKISIRSLEPKTEISFLPENSKTKGANTWKESGGTFGSETKNQLKLFAPQLPGTRARIKLTNPVSPDPVFFPVLILHEATITVRASSKNWRLCIGDNPMGTWPNPRNSSSWRVRQHAANYKPPRFWLKISPTNQNLNLAPHVKVGQMVGFVTEKKSGKAKRRHTNWFPPNHNFVYKLELLNRAMHKVSKIPFKNLSLNSGFRTPLYNRQIGGSSFSRHVYGDAADVIQDANNDDKCDDINGDGKINELDGLVLANQLRKIGGLEAGNHGGIGVYGFIGEKSCGSYCHFDARGYLTRWGSRYRGRRKIAFKWWPKAEYSEDEIPPPAFRNLPGVKYSHTIKKPSGSQ